MKIVSQNWFVFYILEIHSFIHWIGDSKYVNTDYRIGINVIWRSAALFSMAKIEKK